MSKGLIPPNIRKSQEFDVNRKGAVESIWQPLYDFQTYVAAGTVTQMTFFAVPNGQAGKTKEDTNMEAAAVLPAPKSMLVTHIEVVFLPAAVPSNVQDIAAGPPVINTFWNDMYQMMNGGFLDFFIGSKSYLTDAPIGKFSNSFRLDGTASDAVSTTDAATTNSLSTNYASFGGPLYKITPVKLVPNQNFNVTLNFPSTRAVVGNGRIGVILGGFLYRLSQ